MSWFQWPPAQNHKRDVVCVPRKMFEEMSNPFVHHVQTNLVFVQFHVSNCGILNCTIGSNVFGHSRRLLLWHLKMVSIVTLNCLTKIVNLMTMIKTYFWITNFMELFIIIQNSLHISPKTMSLNLAITLDFLIITMKERKIVVSFNFIQDLNFLLGSSERVKSERLKKKTRY